MKDHIPTIAALIALGLVLVIIGVLVVSGKEPGQMLYGAVVTLCAGLTPSFSPNNKPETKPETKEPVA